MAFAPADVVPIVLEPLADKHAPRSEYDAKFSLPYSVASLLVARQGRRHDLRRRRDPRPRVLDLTQRVRYETKDFPTFGKAFPGGRPRRRCATARVLEAELPHQRGGEENPLTDDEVRAKYAGTPRSRSAQPTRAALEDAVLGIEDLPALDAFAVLEPRSRARSRHGVRSPGPLVDMLDE